MEERNERGQTLKEFLEEYDENLYRHPSNTVDMILFTVSQKQLKILLVKRKDHPFIHTWALPGGFVNFDEDLDAAVLRELEEETSITKDTYFRQLYTFGAVDRDPRTRVITTAYLSLTPADNIKYTKANDDAQDACWFTITKHNLHVDENGRLSRIMITNDEQDIHMEYEIQDIAKDNYIETSSKMIDSSTTTLAADHIKAINMAMDQIQHRVASTGILFNLLPKECTLREIQDAYEAVIGRHVDTGNFRRDIRKMLIKLGKKKKVAGKQVELYSFNPMYGYLEENL